MISALFDLLNSQMGPIIIAAFLFVLFMIFLHNINIGLALLIFSIPLSPEITGIFGSEIPVRIDDILIIMLFLAWIMRVGRGESQFYRTPFNSPIIVFFSFMVISTIIGYAYKQVLNNPKYSFLVIVKNFEYFAIFFLAVNNIHTRRQIQNSLRLWMIAFFIIVLYGIGESVLTSCRGRLYDTGWLYDGQSNHVGGYLMVSTTIAIALFFAAKNMRLKLLYLFLIILSIYPFLYNQSKESYLSFSVSLFLFFLMFKRRFLFIPVAFILILFFAIPYFFPHAIATEALKTTRGDTFKLGVTSSDPGMYTSADIRRLTIRRAFQTLPQNPFMGHGAGWRRMAFYDSQIPLLLFENGIIGTAIFLWMLFRIFVNGLKNFIVSKDVYFKAISAAFVASFFGILIQSVPSAAWMITLVIEPFWYFAGIIIAINRINRKEMNMV